MPVAGQTSIPFAVSFSWLENARSCLLFQQAILTGKVGQTGHSEQVFWAWSRFISRSVHATLQVCVHVQWSWTVPTWLTSTHTHTHRQTVFWPAYMNRLSRWA